MAILIADMSIEEHEYALIAQVPLTKSMLVQAMHLRISKDIVDTLQIYHEQVSLSELP